MIEELQKEANIAFCDQVVAGIARILMLPKPKKCWSCHYLTFMTNRCVSCQKREHVYAQGTQIRQQVWNAVVEDLIASRGNEHGVGLAARYPDATPAARPLQEPITCDIGADWED